MTRLPSQGEASGRSMDHMMVPPAVLYQDSWDQHSCRPYSPPEEPSDDMVWGASELDNWIPACQYVCLEAGLDLQGYAAE